jgi:hypothetical protein
MVDEPHSSVAWAWAALAALASAVAAESLAAWTAETLAETVAVLLSAEALSAGVVPALLPTRVVVAAAVFLLELVAVPLAATGTVSVGEQVAMVRAVLTAGAAWPAQVLCERSRTRARGACAAS